MNGTLKELADALVGGCALPDAAVEVAEPRAS
jgi:hypothetical protein